MEENIGKMKLEECFPENYVVIDIETSGLYPNRDRILEVGLLEVENRKPLRKSNSWVLNPTFPDKKFEVPEKITELTGITTEEVAKGWNPHWLLPELQELAQDYSIYTHNGIRFDRLFLDAGFKRISVKSFVQSRFLDSAAIFKAWRLGKLWLLKSQSFFDFANQVLETRAYGVYFSLTYCCEVLGVNTSDLENAHRAGTDVVMVHRVVEKMRDKLLSGGEDGR